ncbi:interleukin-31 receptor subunit alpha-like [Megalops cyprinoides]|uniref:interleukin-31 receptor subunit alpha-like n=1 Tax=Megalops cyprinoides TaxID=118141 RepID=UPI001864149D|nr:interleukin-31 receptor subunit alpha-like [Megalops cyprinoides]XP_036384243.1 interleukin-31 receptor subunit alpha-like [Megalops cyprinoides]
MLSSVLCVFVIITVACKGQSEKEKCDVLPKDPTIKMGEDVQIMFKVPDSGFCSNVPLYSRRKLFWMLNDKKIPEALYTVINSTISAVTIRNFTLQSGTVTCHMDVDGKDVVLGGTTVKAFFPPMKPTNISCTTILKRGFTCYWDSGRDTSLDTSYTVHRKFGNELDNCTSRSSPCAFEFEVLTDTNIIWVEAKNAVGRTESDRVDLHPFSTVKIRPPKNLVAKPVFDSLDVEVAWERAENMQFQLICEVQYLYRDGNSSRKHVINATMMENNSSQNLRIRVERPCTNHTISVRCALDDPDWSPKWSDWSPEVTVLSSLEVATVQLHLWRKIGAPDERGSRTAQLMWKGFPESCNIIEGYRVTIKDENNETKAELFKPTDLKTSITLDKWAYTVSIAAYMDENISEDSIAVPAIGKELPPVGETQAFSRNGQIHVSWSPPNDLVNGYMVDWSADAHDYMWLETQATNATLNGQPFKLYSITVTPLYDKGTGKETTLQAYSKEGAPGKVSNLTVSDVTLTGARVSWPAVPRNECCGFVVNYTVFYKAKAGPELSITVNNTHVYLDNLQPYTEYNIHVMANSVAGGRNSSITFTTRIYGSSFIIALSIIGGVAVMVFLTTGLVCFILVKKRINQSVPDPSLSKVALWPPHHCQKDRCSNLLILRCESPPDKIDICVSTPDPGSEGVSPTPTEDDQLGPEDGQVGQPGPAPVLCQSSAECPSEPGGTPLSARDFPAPEAWEDADSRCVPQGQYQGECRPINPYLKNCVRSVNGTNFVCGERWPGLAAESAPFLEPQPQRSALPLQAYVSVDMFQDGLFNRSA